MTGALAVKPSSDSTTALRVQKSDASAVFDVDTTNKRVGILTESPGYPLDVAGQIRLSGQLISTLATGTAPFSITSTTAVSNLNADMVDGKHSTDFVTSTDLKWRVVSDTTLSSDVTSIQITGLSSYKLIKLTFVGFMSQNVSADVLLKVGFNSDTNSNYYSYWIELVTSGSSIAFSTSSSAATSIETGYIPYTTIPCFMEMDITNTSSSIAKRVHWRTGGYQSNAMKHAWRMGMSDWHNTSNSISTIELVTGYGFRAGTRVLVEGAL